MARALCFNCGEIKTTALSACDHCFAASTGNPALDRAFSEQHFTIGTLQGFGVVVKTINNTCEDGNTRFWTFLYYISEEHPELLQVTLDPAIEDQVIDAYWDLELPEMTVRFAGYDEDSPPSTDPDTPPDDTPTSWSPSSQ